MMSTTPTMNDHPFRSGGTGAGGRCPRCSGDYLVGISQHGTTADQCRKCGGLWFPETSFRTAVTDLDVQQQVLSEPSGPLPANWEVTYVQCPQCRSIMLRRNFRDTTRAGRPSGIIVDVCGEHGVWLDRGEFEAIVRYLVQCQEASLPMTTSAAAKKQPTRSGVAKSKKDGSSDDASSWLVVIADFLNVIW